VEKTEKVLVMKNVSLVIGDGMVYFCF